MYLVHDVSLGKLYAPAYASESPAKSKRADLTAQLYYERRYSRVHALSNDLRLTLAAED
jgi:hypothetical protein